MMTEPQRTRQHYRRNPTVFSNMGNRRKHHGISMLAMLVLCCSLPGVRAGIRGREWDDERFMRRTLSSDPMADSDDCCRRLMNGESKCRDEKEVEHRCRKLTAGGKNGDSNDNIFSRDSHLKHGTSHSSGSTKHKPSGKKPAEKSPHLSDNKPTHRPVTTKPSGKKPVKKKKTSGSSKSMSASKKIKKPTGKKPSGKKPTGKKPSGKKPTGKKPSESHDKPTGKQPTSQPHSKPTHRPESKPSPRPQRKPTPRPQAKPTPQPQRKPTPQPQRKPTPHPQPKPTPRPQAKPTPRPHAKPTKQPSHSKPSEPDRPTSTPISTPTISPYPTVSPRPSFVPTTSMMPSVSLAPSEQPTVSPQPTISNMPSISPGPSLSPTRTPQPSASPTIAPSKTPTSSPAPSFSPTTAPSLAPSVSAMPTTSVNPSFVPTLSTAPSSSPTVHPSLSPSVSKAPTTSPAPTDLPSVSPRPTSTLSPSSAPSISQRPSFTPVPTSSKMPTELPTTTPSPTGTPRPTGSPTSAPTTTFDCEIDETGNVGRVASSGAEVPYFYELETVPGLSEATVQSIVSKYDVAVVEFLIPSVFPQCDLSRLSLTVRRLEEEDVIVGMSTSPPDTPLFGVQCTEPLEGIVSDCYVVDGGISVYADSQDGFQQAVAAIQEEIEAAFTLGEFDDVDPRVISATGIDTLPPTPAPTRAPTTDSQSDGRLPYWGYILIGGAAFVAVAAGVYVVTKRRNRAEQTKQSLEEDDEFYRGSEYRGSVGGPMSSIGGGATQLAAMEEDEDEFESDSEEDVPLGRRLSSSSQVDRPATPVEDDSFQRPSAADRSALLESLNGGGISPEL